MASNGAAERGCFSTPRRPPAPIINKAIGKVVGDVAGVIVEVETPSGNRSYEILLIEYL